MAERGLGLSLEVREPGGPLVAPADRLDVPLLAGDLPPLLEQATCLLELAQFAEVYPLERVAQRVGAGEQDAGPHGDIAVRQLDRAIVDRHDLAVLAGADEAVGGARGVVDWCRG